MTVFIEVNLLFSINSHAYEFTFLLSFKLRHRKVLKKKLHVYHFYFGQIPVILDKSKF